MGWQHTHTEHKEYRVQLYSSSRATTTTAIKYCCTDRLYYNFKTLLLQQQQYTVQNGTQNREHLGQDKEDLGLEKCVAKLFKEKSEFCCIY